MEITDKLKDLAISESGFVFDPFTGVTFNTNATGRLILEGLKEGLDREGMVERIREGFEVEEEDIGRDMDEFVFLLRENGILPSDFTL